ncbi:myeloid cell surface antigen CD33-like [Clarias gariepinus]|uniref:myeloid cell surface antigen CD33-like n=1 Tax=Clarias gariepinus TaxID=13013 RepID=UPI00234CFF18|nr:myeloid cell surface antigen CD33-like [Clarias gariepinus]
MKTLHLALILLSLSGVLTQDSRWGVNYPNNLICAVRGFSVSIPCSYYYPTSNPNNRVTQMLWCSMNSNTVKCEIPPYVYNSSSKTKSDFEYVGDDKSNCTLLIHNVQFSYSGKYKFRFIAHVDKWTGEPGVTLQTADLKVSLIRLSGNGNLKQGDSLNLTCDVNCTHSSSRFVWSKNNEQLNTSGPVLHFPALTVRDSGKYTCTWKTNEMSGSKTISLQVEGERPQTAWPSWIVVMVTAVVIVIVSVITVSWFLCKCRSVQTEQRDDSHTYANVKQEKDKAKICANVEQKKDNNEI